MGCRPRDEWRCPGARTCEAMAKLGCRSRRRPGQHHAQAGHFIDQFERRACVFQHRLILMAAARFDSGWHRTSGNFKVSAMAPARVPAGMACGHDHRQRIGPHRLGDEAIMHRV